MQSSNQPGKISLPFASSGAKQPIPVASQVGIEDGRASYTDGFPPLTRTPLAAGGKPPFGTDMNGVLNAITAIQQWQSAGGLFTYDAALSTSINGYPKGAILLKADASGYWRNSVENNTSNPDSGGAGWFTFSSPHGVAAFAVSGTFTVPDGVTQIWRTACGGGGGGGASPNTTSNVSGGGGGGGAGQSIFMSPLTVTPGQVISFTIGAGGIGGAAGGSTVVGGTTLSGGGAGLSGTAGSAGTASGGISGTGFPRGCDGTDAGNSVGCGNGGMGGSSPMGGGGGGARSTVSLSTRPGYDAGGYGSGGGGAGGLSTSGTISGSAGGSGSGGIVILQW